MNNQKFYFFCTSRYNRLKMRFPFIRVTAKFIRLFDRFTSEINPSIPLNRPSTITILSFTSNCTFTIGITLPYFRNEVTSSVSLADKGFMLLSLGRNTEINIYSFPYFNRTYFQNLFNQIH